ncbi:MAG: hypothetical protein H6683_09005 [Deltaproteobacteria bacterium]|nr:hypothetical protein [Deltaproteobacteria bacterium]
MLNHDVFLLQSTGFIVILGGLIYEVIMVGIGTLCRRACRAMKDEPKSVEIEDASGILMRLT